MKKIIFYLLAMAIVYASLLVMLFINFPQEYLPYKVFLVCSVIGGLAGCMYCLRAVYLNACVHKNWDNDWWPWYFLRPIVSAGCGAASYLFLQAGLLVLEAGTRPNSNDLGFYALAFISGLNVDKFIKKLEDVAEAVWGIEKSRTAEASAKKKE